MNQSRIYLDHNGSTPVTPGVAQELQSFIQQCWGNAGASHPDGREAQNAIGVARERTLGAIGGAGGELMFTSGGTESNNAAIIGAVHARAQREGRRHLVVGRHEHLSVIRPAQRLEAQGFPVTWVEPGEDGRVAPEVLENAIQPDTALVVLMFANNETGILQPTREAAELAHAAGAWLFVDAVCGAGKVAVDVGAIGCDLFSISGHKLHAPKGVGALWMREGVRIEPLVLGCGQQRGMRSGTENTLGAVALGAAMERHAAPSKVPGPELRELRDRLFRGVEELGVGAVRNGHGADLPNTVSVWFPGRSSSDLQSALGDMGLSVSAQASHPDAPALVPAEGASGPSHVLQSMGLGAERASQSLRFSLGSTTHSADIDGALSILQRALGVARVSS